MTAGKDRPYFKGANMSGIYGNDPEDKHFENDLHKYLEDDDEEDDDEGRDLEREKEEQEYFDDDGC